MFDASRCAQTVPNNFTVLVGMYDPQELKQNLQFARTHDLLSEQEMSDLIARGGELASD